jgi:hypothetical protein
MLVYCVVDLVKEMVKSFNFTFIGAQMALGALSTQSYFPSDAYMLNKKGGEENIEILCDNLFKTKGNFILVT